MGILASILGGGAGDLVDGVAGAIDRFVETKEERAAADLLMLKAQQEPDKWQTEINKIEAGHRSMFVAGWRPACGWVCVFALAWSWIIAPLLIFFFPTKELPAIEIGQAISLIMAMLGMGALRSYEKKNELTK